MVLSIKLIFISISLSFGEKSLLYIHMSLKKKIYYRGSKTEAKYEKSTQNGHYRQHNINKNFEANIHDGCFFRRSSVDLAYKEFRNL